MSLASVPDAIAAYRRGGLVMIIDNEDRENEGDLCLPAQFVTAEALTFMAVRGRGLICVPMLGETLDRLQLPNLAQFRDEADRDGNAPNFAMPVDARRGVTSGISSEDRAVTIRALIDPATQASDLTCPGHVFPLRYAPGGVLSRGGQTEASVDLAILAGLTPAAVICEVMNDDGTMARLPQLAELGAAYDIPVVSVAQIVAYRLQGAYVASR